MLYIIINLGCYINNKEIIVKEKKKCHNLFLISLVLFIIQVIIHIMGYFITGVFGIAFLLESYEYSVIKIIDTSNSTSVIYINLHINKEIDYCYNLN